jgi:chromosome segregation ATPase
MTTPDDEERTGGPLGSGHAVPPPLPTKRPGGGAAVSKPDPFQEPPQPRLPVGADLEAKLEYFRQVIRQKDEMLERARSLYLERVAEVEQLRAASTALSAELVQLRESGGSAEDRVDELCRQLATKVAERMHLTRALAEANAKLEGGQRYIEAQRAAHSAMEESLESERIRAAELEGELQAARQALAQAEAERARVAAENAELAVSLETATWRASSTDGGSAEADAQALAAERAARQAAEEALAQERGRARGPLADLHAALGEELEDEKKARAAAEEALAQAQAALDEERAARASAEASLAEEKGTNAALSEEVALLTAELSQPHEAIISDHESVDFGGAEREALKAEIAGLKRKLVTAESALEAAASLRQKVARLEAQIRSGHK